MRAAALRLERRWLLVAAGLGLLLAVLDEVWLLHVRSGGVLSMDESGYLSIAAGNADALADHGPIGLVREVVGQHYQAPLVPLVAGLLENLLGRSVDVAFAVLALAHLVLVLATFAVGRRFCSAPWALLAAAIVGCMPQAIAYSRFFQFALPAAALLMLTLWALLRSEGLSQRRWAIAFGILAGMLPLTRTMTIAFLPGFLLAALLQVHVHRRPGSRANLGLACTAAAVTAATWFAPNVRYVGHYLLHFGYGSDASRFGGASPILSWGFWSREARLMLEALNLPLGAIVLAGLLGGIVLVLRARIRGSLPASSFFGSEILALVIVFGEGYLALSSTANVGAAFCLPLLSIAVVLSVVAMASLRPSLAGALAAAALAAALLALVAATGAIHAIARTTAVRVPGFGEVPVLGGEHPFFAELASSGYPVGRPADSLPPSLASWQARMHGLARTLVATLPSGRGPALIGAPSDPVYSANGFVLAGRLWLGRELRAADVLAPRATGSEAAERAYRRLIRNLGAEALVIPSPLLYRSWMPHPGALVAAVRSSGYRLVARVREPDAVISIWRRPRSRARQPR